MINFSAWLTQASLSLLQPVLHLTTATSCATATFPVKVKGWCIRGNVTDLLSAHFWLLEVLSSTIFTKSSILVHCVTLLLHRALPILHHSPSCTSDPSSAAPPSSFTSLSPLCYVCINTEPFTWSLPGSIMPCALLGRGPSGVASRQIRYRRDQLKCRCDCA